MKVTLNKGETLCWTCANCTDDKCEFVKNDGNYLPDYIKKVGKKNLKTKKGEPMIVYLVRNCSNYTPDPECVITCKYCGQQYVLQTLHNKVLDGGYCYDCHVKRKETYYKPKEWQKGKRPPLPKEKKCAICGKVFEPQSSTQKYCSRDCVQAANTRHKRKLRQLQSKMKKDKALRQKWELDNAVAKIEKKTENLLKEMAQKHNAVTGEIKKRYKEQYDKFRAEWEAARSAELDPIETEYTRTIQEIAQEKEELIAKAKAEIMEEDKK